MYHSRAHAAATQVQINIQSLIKHQKSELKQSLAVVKEMHVTAVKAIGTATACRDAVAQDADYRVVSSNLIIT